MNRKAPHRQSLSKKPATELSRARVERFRKRAGQKDFAAAHLDVARNAKLPSARWDGVRRGRGQRTGSALKLAALMLAGAAVVIALALSVFQQRERLGRAAKDPIVNQPALGQADGPGEDVASVAPPEGGDELAPPLVPPELGGLPQAVGGSRQAAPETQGAREVAAAPEPWADALAAGETPGFDEVCFDDFRPDQNGIAPDELRRWLAVAGGEAAQMSQQPRQATQVNGLYRPRAPWPAGTALRLSSLPQDGFRIHIIAGERAVTLAYYSQPRPSWAAYAAEPSAKPVPAPIAFIGYDNDRYSRTAGHAGGSNVPATFSLHHEDDQLVVTRGNIRLLTAALAGRPGEVYFEGPAAWRGIWLYRCGPVPADAAEKLDAEHGRPLVLRSEKPGRLPWRTKLPRGAALQRTDEGASRLSSRGGEATAAYSIPESGLHEVIVQVGEAAPGTGLFLGDKEGRPIARVGFYRDGRTGRLAATYSPPGQRREQIEFPAHEPTPLVRPGQWFRLVLGLGTLKCWTSEDGKHWARLPAPPPRGLSLGYGAIGIDCSASAAAAVGEARPGEAERAISLKHLEIRELGGLTSLASADARERAPALDNQPDIAAWLQAVADHEPPQVDSDDWRRACALRTLAGSPPRDLAMNLVAGLLGDSIARPASVEKRLAALHDASLLWDGADPAEAERLLRCYDFCGEALVSEDRSKPFELMLGALVRSELWTVSPVDVFRGPCGRSELHRHVAAGDFQAARFLSEQMAYWRPTALGRRGAQSPATELTAWRDWAEYLASQAGNASPKAAAPTSGRRGATPEERAQAARQAAWRHPFIDQVSKDAFNLMSEFEAALEAEAYEDACQTVITANPQAGLGLVPWSKDPQLFASFPTAFAIATQTQPALRETLLEKFAEPGLIRVRQAKGAGDLAALRAATVQLVGTPAASEAHHFLGDRALAAGEFHAAIGHYQRAMPHASADARKQLAALLRLAGALAGRDLGAPASEPIEFGGARLSPDELEQFVAARLKQRRFIENSPVAPRDSMLSPARIEMRPWGQDIDTGGGEVSVVCDADTMYVASQFELRAFKLADGSAKWPPNGAARGAAAQGGVPCRLALGNGRVIGRRWVGGNDWAIVCVDAANGQTAWTLGPQYVFPGEQLIADPLLIGDQVFALTSLRHSDGTLDVRLLVLDAASGQPKRQHVLLRLRDLWNGTVPCAATAVDDRLIATVGGCVLCCDLAGHTLWVRKQTRVPDSLPQPGGAPRRHPEPPIVLEGRVYAMDLGARELNCVDPETGRLHWRYAALDLRRLFAADAGLVILDTADGLAALDAATGKLTWRRDVEHLLEARACGEARLLYTSRQQVSPNAWRASLVWLDLQTGQELARSTLAEIGSGGAPQLGPMVRHASRTWVVAGNQGDAKRRAWEVAPRGAAPAMPREADALKPWLPDGMSGLTASLRDDAAGSLGWNLLASSSDGQTGWRGKWQDQPDVVATLATRANPVRMIRRVALPAAGPCKLLIHVGHEGGQRWELEIAAAGKPVFRSEVSSKTAAGGWLRREVDLSALAGQTLWLSATARCLDGKLAHPIWGKLEIADSRSR